MPKGRNTIKNGCLRLGVFDLGLNQSIQQVNEEISTATSAPAAAAQPPVKEQSRTDQKAAHQ
jgi:hypothetical protein